MCEINDTNKPNYMPVLGSQQQALTVLPPQVALFAGGIDL
jgi:hypothetical protein